MEQDKFIENILNSTSGITKVNPSDSLFSKINSKIEETKPVDKTTKWLVAASIAVLISLNIVFFNSKKDTNSSNELSELVSTTNNQLY